MGRHEKFNRMVGILKDAWWSQGLLSYNFYYRKYQNGGYYLVCPNNYAVAEQVRKHSDIRALYDLHYYFWLTIKEYFTNQTNSAQYYLIRKHGMVRVR